MVKYEYETMENYESRMKKTIKLWFINIIIYGISGVTLGLIQVTQPLTILFKYLTIYLCVMLVLCFISVLFDCTEELRHTKELEYLKKRK
jgi:MFS superfamily sulfate permease-like transporter